MLFPLFYVALVGAVSPVQKVVQLLDQLKTQVQSDLSNEEKMMEEYTSWCDEEANTKEDAITSSKRTIGDLSATITDSEATIQDLTSTIGDLTNKISASEADLQSATGIREKENGDFVAAEKELVDTVDTTERAYSVLKRNLSLVQSGKVAENLDSLATGLNKIVEASWVNSRQKEVIQSLLQSKASEGDDDLSLQPQAQVSNYQSASGGILDTIEDMKEKAEEALSSTRKDEMEAAHSFAMLKQGLEDEIAVMKKQLSDSQQSKSATEEELHAAKAELVTTQNTLAADTQYLEELKESCSVKAAQWAERQKSAGEEMGAIAKAKEILESGVKVFLQTSVSIETKAESEENTSRRAKVVRILTNLNKQYHSYALMQLSGQARSDPFGKVRGLIESMIAKLMQEAAEEADQKAFCDEETSKSKQKQSELNADLDKNSVRIEKAEAGKAKLQTEIKTLEEEVSEIDAGQAEATKVRQDEHAEFLKSSKDFKDSAAAVASAIQVLNEYYSQGAFVQVKTTEGPEFGGAKGDVGSTITSMLEVAESDFTRLLAEAESEEDAAKTAYDKLTQENQVTRAAKEAEAKGKGSEVKQLETSLLNYKEDHTSTSKELDAVLAYLDKLKPQCETKVMSYAERKERREQEINGLKEALNVLSGDTAFLQVRDARRA